MTRSRLTVTSDQSCATHAAAQFLHWQQEPVAHPEQASPAGQTPSAVHAGAHVRSAKRQVSPEPQASSSSHWPGAIGTQAPRQSSHFGHPLVAHGSHVEPGPHPSHPSHAGAQTPVAKRHTPPWQ